MESSPLLASMVSTTLTSAMRTYEQGDPMEKLARKWPCAPCGCLLGVIHLIIGLIILTVDLVSAPDERTVFAISAALLCFLCAVLSFIAVRRLDSCAQLLLLLFSIITLSICLVISFNSARTINDICNHRNCEDPKNLIQAILLVFALTEFFTSLVSSIVCYRSLMKAYGVRNASSPYSTLIVGDYKTLLRTPEIVDPRLIESVTASQTV